MQDLEYYKNLADEIVRKNYDRNILWDKIDAAENFRFELPDNLPKWVRLVKSTNLHDSLAAAREFIVGWKNHHLPRPYVVNAPP